MSLTDLFGFGLAYTRRDEGFKKRCNQKAKSLQQPKQAVEFCGPLRRGETESEQLQPPQATRECSEAAALQHHLSYQYVSEATGRVNKEE